MKTTFQQKQQSIHHQKTKAKSDLSATNRTHDQVCLTCLPTIRYNQTREHFRVGCQIAGYSSELHFFCRFLALLSIRTRQCNEQKSSCRRHYPCLHSLLLCLDNRSIYVIMAGSVDWLWGRMVRPFRNWKKPASNLSQSFLLVDGWF